MKSIRTPWGNFPEVRYQHPLGEAKKHFAYLAAKAGDSEGAFRLVNDLIVPSRVEEIKQFLDQYQGATLVPVHAEEATGRNKIPLAYAEVLAKYTGFPVNYEVVQSNRANHTGASAFHRIAIQPQFSGSVITGANYVIIDDSLAMGGTLASLKGYIESNGGNVVLATTLTAYPGYLKIQITEKMLSQLEQKHGGALQTLLQDELGYGTELLTQGEAGHLKKAPDVDTIRNRIIKARRQAGF